MEVKLSLHHFYGPPQVYASITICYAALLNGVDWSFAAGIINHLGNIPLNMAQKSLLDSINLYATAFGNIVCFITINKMGRKKTVLLSLFLHVIAWGLMLLFPENLNVVYFCRICSGLAGGLRGAVVTYISEIADKNRRGVLISLFGLTLSSGITLSYTIEYFFSWFMVSRISLVLAVTGFIQVCFFPETKYYYLLKNDVEKARKSMLWFQPSLPAEQMDEEINEICKTQAILRRKNKPFYYIFQNSTVIKSMIFCNFLVIFRTGSGRIPLTADPYDFYRQFQLPVNYEVLILAQGIAEVTSSIVCTAIVDSFNRKTMLQLSCWLMNAAILVTAIINVFTVPSFAFIGQWIQVVCLLSYYTLAVGFLLMFTTILVSEIASSMTEARGIVTSTSFIVSDIIGAIYTESFPMVLQTIRIEYVLIFFFVNLCLLSLTAHFIPETSGKELHLIVLSKKAKNENETTNL